MNEKEVARTAALDPVNILCIAVMLCSACGLIWIFLTWAP